MSERREIRGEGEREGTEGRDRRKGEKGRDRMNTVKRHTYIFNTG